MGKYNFTVREATPEQTAEIDSAIAELRAWLIATGFGEQERPPSTLSAEEIERFFREPKAITEALRAKAEYLARNKA